METIILLPVIVWLSVAPQSTCYLCGASFFALDDCPLCPTCLEAEQSRWQDYQDAREAQRPPF
jgi:hypothetical protein